MKNDPQPQISSLHKMLKDKQSEALPESRIEFESKAMLLHIYMDLEEFLYTKKKFIDQTTEEQKNCIGDDLDEINCYCYYWFCYSFYWNL